MSDKVYRIHCEVSDGILTTEYTVEIRTSQDLSIFLRTQKKNVAWVDGKTTIAVGLILRDTVWKMSLIELPHEADGGETRIWVKDEQLVRLDVGERRLTDEQYGRFKKALREEPNDE